MDCPALAEAESPREHGKAFAGPESGEGARMREFKLLGWIVTLEFGPCAAFRDLRPGPHPFRWTVYVLGRRPREWSEVERFRTVRQRPRRAQNPKDRLLLCAKLTAPGELATSSTLVTPSSEGQPGQRAPSLVRPV